MGSGCRDVGVGVGGEEEGFEGEEEKKLEIEGRGTERRGSYGDDDT